MTRSSASATKRRTFAFTVWSLGAFILLGGALAQHLGFFLNITPSLPRGIWRADHGPLVVRQGEIVSVTPPDSAAISTLRGLGYMSFTLLKPVAAIPGDIVQIGQRGISVNGKPVPNSKALPHDSAGRALPHMANGTYRVKPNTVWLVSSYNPASLDSRYFGPVPTTALRYRATPILTEAGAP